MFGKLGTTSKLIGMAKDNFSGRFSSNVSATFRDVSATTQSSARTCPYAANGIASPIFGGLRQAKFGQYRATSHRKPLETRLSDATQLLRQRHVPLDLVGVGLVAPVGRRRLRRVVVDVGDLRPRQRPQGGRDELRDDPALSKWAITTAHTASKFVSRSGYMTVPMRRRSRATPVPRTCRMLTAHVPTTELRPHLARL